MVIFGAGASYDSSPDFPNAIQQYPEARLPLADQLFELRDNFAEALKRYEECHGIIPHLRDKRSGSVEQVLEKLRNEIPEKARRTAQLIAIQFYLRDIIRDSQNLWVNRTRGITNYTALLEQVEHRRQPDETVCLVTFNYDTMIEQALKAHDRPLINLNDYISRDDYRLIKLHGSIDWVQQALTPGTGQPGTPTSWERVAPIIKSKRHMLSDSYFKESRGLPDEGVFLPALALPVETKSDFHCPKEHVQALGDMIPHVTRLLVIGWRASEKHFLELFASKASAGIQIVTVSGSQKASTETLEALRAAGIQPRDIHPLDDSFTSFILDKKLDMMLAR